MARLQVATAARRIAPAALAAWLLAAGAQPAGAQPPPDEAWRTIESPHFRITFPGPLEVLARRAAELAERARADLGAEFLDAPGGRIDVVLTDHADLSNAVATVWPSNRVVVYVRPPADSVSLGYFDDYLELLLVHELAHIHHLDHAAGLGRLFRWLVGRSPTFLSFPGTLEPGWVVEGIGTWYESALSGTGRVHGTYHEMVLRTAALEGRFETLGQAEGNSPAWPAGARSYAYGSLFVDYLLETYGRDRMGDFARRLAGLRNLTPNRAATHVFGVPLTEAWDAWANRWREAAARLDGELARYGPITEPERLTRGARYAQHPVVSSHGEALIYVRSDGRSDPRLVAEDPAGGGRRTITRTNHVTTFDLLSSGAIVFAQREFADRYRIFSDLYIAEPDGSVRRVTERARLTAPSAEPDGLSVVAVSEGHGTQRLVRVALADGAVTELAPPDPEVYWAYPSVSPDGRWIAASRWADGRHDVVILDAAGRLRHRVTSDRALDFAPAWGPDGRRLVWSSDRMGIPNIFAVAIDPATGAPDAPVMLTNVRTGALFPSVDPSGAWLYFSGYHADGWEVERVSFQPADAPPAPAPAARWDPAGTPAATGRQAVTAPGPGQAPNPSPPARPYRSMRTLWPTWWLPSLREPVAVAGTADGRVPRRQLLGWSIGGQTSGVDLVGRHAWGARARAFTSGEKGEGLFAYDYRGLGNPTVGFFVSQQWREDGFRIPPEQIHHPSPDAFYVLARERRAAASVRLDRPSFRTPVSLALSGGLVRQDREPLDGTLRPTSQVRLRRPSSTLGEGVVTFSVSTARSHAFQMGAARGIAASVETRMRRDLDVSPLLRGAPGDRSVNDVIGRLRAFLPLPWPGSAASVLAFRATAGAAAGPGSGAGHFSAGGSSFTVPPQFSILAAARPSVLFPVRGYETAVRSGRRAWSSSLEYRMPIALVNRGAGAWAVHLDRILGSVFVDAGDAWGTVRDPRRTASHVLLSAGAEVTGDLLVAYTPVRLRFGVAFPMVDVEGPRYYLRFGLPF